MLPRRVATLERLQPKTRFQWISRETTTFQWISRIWGIATFQPVSWTSAVGHEPNVPGRCPSLFDVWLLSHSLRPVHSLRPAIACPNGEMSCFMNKKMSYQQPIWLRISFKSLETTLMWLFTVFRAQRLPFAFRSTMSSFNQSFILANSLKRHCKEDDPDP